MSPPTAATQPTASPATSRDAVDADPKREALEAAVEQLRATPGDHAGVADLARRVGVGSAELRTLVSLHYHTSPNELVARARVNFARQELLATRRRPGAIAIDAGYPESAPFEASFLRYTGLTPAAYRHMGRTGVFAMKLPRGVRVDHLLRALGRDPDGRTERVRDGRLSRALRLGGRPALLTVQFTRDLAKATVDTRGTLSPAQAGAAHEALQRLVGLTLDPAPFERRAREDPQIHRLIRTRRGLRIPQTPDAFEGLVWTVVGQQVNLAFAFTCRNRLIDLAGARAGGGLRAHPTPADVARLDYSDLTSRQYSRRKAEYLIDAARAIEAGALDLEGLVRASATTSERTLTAVRGLGRWSVNYIMMRSLSFADCVPVGDAGLVRALQEFHGLDERPGPDQTLALMERYAPHRSLATFHLWKTIVEPA